uniref:Uncharacterized protein n=1 Tax=Arundo donax TaxID=35708 RepID=A0A0A9GUP1_ARUDO
MLTSNLLHGMLDYIKMLVLLLSRNLHSLQYKIETHVILILVV